MTAAALGRWAAGAERGESCVSAVADGRRQPPERVMAAARALHVKGRVPLVQRRERTGEIAYIAQRTWKRQGDR